jgi:hypothetical protein
MPYNRGMIQAPVPAPGQASLVEQHVTLPRRSAALDTRAAAGLAAFASGVAHG